MTLLWGHALSRKRLVDHTQQLHPAFFKLWSIEPTNGVAPLHVLLQDLRMKQRDWRGLGRGIRQVSGELENTQ